MNKYIFILFFIFVFFNCAKKEPTRIERIETEKCIREIIMLFENKKFKKAYNKSLKYVSYDKFVDALSKVYTVNGKLIDRFQIGHQYTNKTKMFEFGSGSKEIFKDKYNFFEAVYILQFKNILIQESIFVTKINGEHKIYKLIYKKANPELLGVDGRQRFNAIESKEIEDYINAKYKEVILSKK